MWKSALTLGWLGSSLRGGLVSRGYSWGKSHITSLLSKLTSCQRRNMLQWAQRPPLFSSQRMTRHVNPAGCLFPQQGAFLSHLCGLPVHLVGDCYIKQRRDCILMSFGKDKMKIYPKEIGQIRQRLLCTKYIKGALNPNGTKSTGINKTIHQVSL